MSDEDHDKEAEMEMLLWDSLHELVHRYHRFFNVPETKIAQKIEEWAVNNQ